jgi:hypothetical protein
MKIAAVVAVLICAGCASRSGVVQLGPDTFMLAKQAATGFPGLGNLKAELIAEGAAHCRTAGKEFKIVSTSESQPPFVMGNYPRAEIEFVCLQLGDRELARPKMERAPDTVIQIR